VGHRCEITPAVPLQNNLNTLPSEHVDVKFSITLLQVNCLATETVSFDMIISDTVGKCCNVMVMLQLSFMALTLQGVAPNLNPSGGDM
jgi:hypothetical protein